jgi:hypothetical protein
MPEVGDRVVVESRKIGQAERDGVVTGVAGRLLTVKWATGEESTFVPGPGSMRVVGKMREATGKKAGAPAKTAKSAPTGKKTAKKSTR